VDGEGGEGQLRLGGVRGERGQPTPPSSSRTGARRAGRASRQAGKQASRQAGQADTLLWRLLSGRIGPNLRACHACWPTARRLTWGTACPALSATGTCSCRQDIRRRQAHHSSQSCPSSLLCPNPAPILPQSRPHPAPRPRFFACSTPCSCPLRHSASSLPYHVLSNRALLLHGLPLSRMLRPVPSQSLPSRRHPLPSPVAPNRATYTRLFAVGRRPPATVRH
jgi:hypothetical protein